MSEHGLFWDDLTDDLKDPAYKREFLRQSLRIQTIDNLINELDVAREGLEMSKADVARAIGAEPAAVRRVFSAQGNPTLGTLSDIAAAVGMMISLTPLSAATAKVVTSVLTPTKPPKVGQQKVKPVAGTTSKAKAPSAGQIVKGTARKPSTTSATRSRGRRNALAQTRVDA